MPGRNPLHPPPCPNGCFGSRPLNDNASYEYTPDGIFLTCHGCGRRFEWTFDQKYRIDCKQCGRQFPSRAIPPAYKDYIEHDDGGGHWEYTCDRCEATERDEDEDADQLDTDRAGEAGSDVTDDQEGPKEQTPPLHPIENIPFSRRRKTLRDSLSDIEDFL